MGILLIIGGVLIALYPPLLSIIVAMILISAGTILTVIGYRLKKTARKFDDPFIDFFMKI
jgi:hypothetical protein